MPDIVISEFMAKEAVERLRAAHETVYDATLVDRPDELNVLLSNARAVIVRNRTQVRPPLLDGAPKLECVGRLGVGLDNIDAVACAKRGVAVYPAAGANDISVAEYVMTVAPMLLRRAYLATCEVAAGGWPRQKMMGRELAGKIMGLVGFGAIAREVASRAIALGMQVIAYDPVLDPADPAWKKARKVSLDALLATADVVSLHVPLTEATRRMIDAGRIGQMKTDAVLVNAARGGIVDEAALADALRDGRLGGAALDVFEVEPLTVEAGTRFAGISNLVLTPHIAGVTLESNLRVSDKIADLVLSHLARV